ncbi:MerR family transcriptional regulator [Fuscibacter oryzae]|uniref:MerR family DNA-binding transcriptional regulator n=1 Tax=Fuscibacter oryzae TaxID=2803939 RepID=A0A8J7MMI7_9RHOB|nr:MerR family DNA-binding transcriptional regulator [Fuscibacter oryzae]MBL4926922.1 MerR family DNA-binding transcriptional regulator [Fuscibacter oryzae]
MTRHTTDTLTIRQMCDAFGVTPRTLRFYEAKELLSPLRQGTRRLFSHKDRARLTLILRGKRFGFSLEEIRQLLGMYDPAGSNGAQLEKTHEIALERLALMEAQRADLDIAITELKGQLVEIQGRIARFRAAAE